jgi:hypothetical protein
MVHRALKVRQDHAGLGNRVTTTIFVNDTLDVIEFVCGENNAAERHTPADRTRTGTRNCYRDSIAIRGCENFRDLLDVLREYNSIRVAIADEAGV